MTHLIPFLSYLLILVCAKTNDDSGSVEGEQCSRNCQGIGYECVDGHCYCADGYIPHAFLDRCMRCPGLGEKCYGPCCDYSGTTTLVCWQGICQPCRDSYNNWICRESMDNILLVSSTQIAMAAALVLGIIATFVMLYKLCAASNIRPLGNSDNYDGRLSIGSLQLYVEERLRDAPPRYSGTAPSSSAVLPATVYVNAGFIHDSSIPPPPYTPPKEENQNSALHI